jgi:hypothetical protein
MKPSYIKYYVALLAFCLPLCFAFSQNVSVYTQHGDVKRTGWNAGEKKLTVANVKAASFGKLYSLDVDDQTYAQPLVVSDLTIAGGKHNVVFVATVNNSIYAFDADNGTRYWVKNYNPAGQRPPKNTDMTGACGGGYRDFSGNMGIVGTPVIDSVSKTMYFVNRTTDTPPGNNGTGSFFQYFHAIDLATGNERANSPVLITAQVSGTGDGNVNGIITFNPQKQNQRPGLALAKGIVYVGYASHCDWGPYHGWLLGYDATTLQQKIVYNTTPDGYNGGIWMSAGAPAVDETGNLYVAVGNGSVGVGNDRSNVRNRSESALKLTPAGNTLAVSSFFTPKNFQELENADLDFGVTQVLLVPGTNLAVTGCKDGNIYVMNRDNMGGFNATTDNVVQTISLGSGKSLRSSFAYFKGSQKSFFYTWSENAALKAFPYSPATGKFDEAGVVIGSAQGPNGANGTLLSVSSDGSKDGTGILWASHAASGDANQSVRPGILRAFDANDVTKELWNSNQNPNDNIGTYAKFVCPTIANGKVYMATFSNKFVIYGVTDTTQQVACNGTSNLARGKTTVASSNESSFYPASNATDGNATTRWSSAYSDPQWIYVDLGSCYNVCQVKLAWEAAYGKDYQMQVSDDATTWTTVQTVTGNTSLTNILPVKGAGRYVRMYGTARGITAGYSLFEFEVYGTAANTCGTPATLSVSAITRTSATLSWAAVSGATAYNVQYKTVAATAYTPVTVSTNSLSLSTLSCGTDYLFKVQAVCSANSDFSTDKAFSTSICDAACSFLPTRWQSQDVGRVGIVGEACFNNNIFRLKASGRDIWEGADGFRFAFKTFNGDGKVTARIDSLIANNPWAKAGIMFRETLDSTSRNALMALTPGNGATFQYRLTAGGQSLNTALAGIKAPYYVMVVKRGNRYAGYISADSVVWKQVGATVDLGFGSGPITAGIALSSHDNGQLARAVFSQVPIVFSADTTVNTTPPTPVCSTPNVALNRPAASSSTLSVDKSIYEFRAFDGDAATRWASSQGTDPQWLLVDLGKRYNVCSVSIDWAAELAKDYQIQISDDAAAWTTLKTITGNTAFSNILSVSGTGRFVRMYATARGTTLGYSINEMRVSGTALPDQPINLALGKTVAASSTENGFYPAAQAVDGLGSTRWASLPNIDPSWIYVDLGKTYTLSQVVLDWEVALGKDFQIQVSGDATTWNTVKTVSGNTSYVNVVPVSGTGRYVRMLGTVRGYAAGYSLYEFEVYGSEVAATASVYEAENAVLSGVQASTLWSGYSGTGFGDYINPAGDYINWTVNVPSAGSYQLGFRYALGSGANRPLELKVNGAVAQSALAFPPTATWTDWQFVRINATLAAGNNTIRLTATGLSGANVDRLEVITAPAALAAVQRIAEPAAVTVEKKAAIRLYPVPATDLLTIESDGVLGEVKVADGLRGFRQRVVIVSREAGRVILDVSSLPGGVYVVAVLADGKWVSSTISKQ